MSIKQALISVSDKIGIIEFARSCATRRRHPLDRRHRQIAEGCGPAVTEVSDYTGFPEMLDGRVKTLHPKIHAGILARQDLPEHMAAMEKRGNSGYRAGGRESLSLRADRGAARTAAFEEAIENIDIGGPAMVRAAAKNYKSVTVVTDPADYAPLFDGKSKSSGGKVSPEPVSAWRARHSRIPPPTTAPSATT